MEVMAPGESKLTFELTFLNIYLFTASIANFLVKYKNQMILEYKKTSGENLKTWKLAWKRKESK